LQGDGTCAKGQGNACQTLGDAGCATCSGSGSTEVCLSCKNDAYFLAPNKKSCKAACDAEKEIETPGASPKACKCNESKGYTLQGDGTCAKDSEGKCKTENCQECTGKGTANEVCTKCTSTHYLTPTNQCVSDCTAIKGYYGDTDKKCKPCSPECAECVGPANNQCSACPAGKKLTYTADSHPNNGGACGDACKVSADGTGCETCGAQIGGTAYCSKCKTSTQAPLNGNCAASSRAAFCTKMGNGVCTQCTANYFLKDGGCYQTDRQPGKQICTTASSAGKCQTCANGLQPNNGACPSCHSTCKTCSTADTANACTTCAAGYYMIGSGPNTCISCESDSGSVKGVANCMSCAPPSSNTGSVLCYLIQNTNKSGLSTGAIAGISVAVIVVVGGLVGFLCWWFICRGKA
ncbi:Variant-specific surface protein, partial [Giardia duodenalis]